MGWTLTTYSGSRATGSPSNLRTCMFELIRAIDERRECIGGMPDYWYVANEPPSYQKLNPSIDDLQGLKCSGRLGGAIDKRNLAWLNMNRITERVKSFLSSGVFVVASGSDTPYTVASMEAAIGTELANPTRVNEARWWQSIQDALDLMVHCKKTLLADTSEAESVITHSHIDLDYPEAFDNYVYSAYIDEKQDSWDARGEISGPEGISGINNNPGWRVHSYKFQNEQFFPFYQPDAWWVWHIVTSSRIGIKFDATPLKGAVVGVKYGLGFGASGTGISAHNVTVNGTAATISATPTYVTIDPSTIELGVYSYADLVLTTEAPETNPFSGLYGFANVALNSLVLHFDIASELTDQT